MTVSLSIYTGSSDDASGYLLIRSEDSSVEGVRPRYVSVHRVAAVAWGLLDGLDDEREVHHRDGCPIHNSESNLDALDAVEHGSVTREQIEERRSRA